MLKRIKQNVLTAAKMLGILDLLGTSRWRQNRLLILGYHGVSLDDEHEWNSELFMTSELLRQRFQLISEKGCTVLPLGEALERLHGGTLPSKALSITFDDGFYDFYKNAFPILRDFGFPATVYVTTFYSEFNKPIFGIAADYLLWKEKSKGLNCEALIERTEVIDLGVESERRRAHSLIVEHAQINKLSAVQKDEMLQNLCVQLDIDYANFCRSRLFQLMTIEEIGEIAALGIDVQLHTHRHRVPYVEELFVREIQENRRVITAATSNYPVHLCYPSGEHDPLFFPWLEATDVISATTCRPSLSTKSTNPFLLPRLIDTSGLSPIEFESWLEGVSQVLPQRH